MTVAFKKVIELPNVGMFRKVSEWEEFTKWVNVKDETKAITTVEVGKQDFMMSFFASFTNEESQEVKIVLADSITSKLLEDTKTKDTKTDESPLPKAIYVVVTEFDDFEGKGSPIAHETKALTLEDAVKRQESLGNRYGASEIYKAVKVKVK